MREQRAAVAQHVDDRVVRLPDVQAGEDQPRRAASTAGTRRAVDRIDLRGGVLVHQAVLLADREVFLAVAGRGVHHAGAVFGGDVVAEHHRDLAIGVERMLQLLAFQLGAVDAAEHDDVVRRRSARAPCRPALRPAPADGAGRRARGPSTSTYSSSGPSVTARLAGSVHGVVVQIGIATSTPSSTRRRRTPRPAPADRARRRRHRPPARPCRRIRSRPRPAPSRSRSTSAPASRRAPGGRARRSSPANACMSASMAKSIVRYGFSQSPSTPRRLKSRRWQVDLLGRRTRGTWRGTRRRRACRRPCRTSSRPRVRSAGRGSPSPARRARRSRPAASTSRPRP